MSKQRPLPPAPDAFDRRYRPQFVATVARERVESSPPEMFSDGRVAAKVEWISCPSHRIDALYAQRATLLRRLAEGDEAARPEYERTLAALRNLQEREADVVHDRMSREAQQHRQNLQLLDDAERFLQQHAHLVPSP